MYKRRVNTLFLLIILSVNTWGVDPKKDNIDVNSLYFENISTKDLLPNSVIYRINQDSLGFLWLSSNDGLFRYDGQKFKIFRNIPNNPNSITSKISRDMHLDFSGNPIILYANMLDKVDTRTGKITHYDRIKTNSGDEQLKSAYQFVNTPENNSFITSHHYGLLMHQGDSTILDLFNYKQLYPAIANRLDAIAYSDHCLYVGRKKEGIYKINLNDDNTEILNVVQIAKIDHSEICTILPDQKNNLIWVGTSDGLVLINLKSGKVSCFEPKRKNVNFLPNSEILSLLVDEQNNLWVGSREHGLTIVSIPEILAEDNNAAGIQYFPTNREGSLTNRCINNIFKDNNGNIWLGTYSGGLQFVAEYKRKIHALEYQPGNYQSPSHPKVWGICEDNNGNIWLGTDGGGIDVWNSEEGIIKHYKKESNGKSISDNAILCAMKDSNGKLWFGTYRGGINIIDPVKDEIIIHKQLPTPYDNDYISDIRIIYESTFGNIWIGTNSRGICYYDKNKNSFTNIKELGSIDVRSIYEPSENELWIGTLVNGLIHYDRSTNTIKKYTIDKQSENSISSNNINTIKAGANGKLWIGTEFGGLSCLDIESEKFENFNTLNGLANNTILSILEDANGYLWLSTNEGISRFDPSNQSFINYDKTNGVLSGEFLSGSNIAASDGSFYFGNSNGLNYFNPEYIQQSELTPKVVFTELTVNNEIVDPGKDIINQNIEFNPTIRLNHKQSVFTISFQALHFPFANKSQYKYMLRGYDKEWNLAGRNNSATYRQLPAGDYKLLVAASNPDGIWSNIYASIPIKITPPIWKTIWAFFFYMLILLVFARFFFRFRMNQIKTLNQLQYEKRIRQKEQKIHQERLVFFTNISHELRTPLTMVECAVEDLKNNLKTSKNKKTQESIRTASFHSSRLLELINQLLEFRRIETGNPRILIEKIDLNEWITSYLSNFKELANSKSISLKITMPLNHLYLYADPDKLSMIINNLLSNALKFAPKKGSIEVLTEERRNKIIIEVINSGMGISSKELPNIFKRYYKTDSSSTSTGIGLSLTKSLVDLHHGSIDVSSTQGKETRFSVKFPKGSKHFEAEQFKKNNKTNSPEEEIIIEEEIPEIHISKENKIILIIEDNLDISSLLASKFSETFDVKIAENGEDGIEIAKNYIPDIIISDIMMPGIQGTEVCEILKKNVATSHIPIILLTAKGTVDDELIGLNVGADDYISKPFNFKILEARVNTLLKNRIKLLNYFSGINLPDNINFELDKTQQLEHEFLEKVEQLILEKYLNSNSSVNEIAEDLNFSRSSLYRKIKMLTGKSINEFVRSVKIKKAAQLLTNKNITISETAYQVGINDLKYFRENFVQQFGETPSAYKKRVRSS